MLVTMVVMEGMVLVLVMLMMMMLMCVVMLVQGLPFVQAGHCLANLLERDCLGKLLVLVQNWILIGRWLLVGQPQLCLTTLKALPVRNVAPIGQFCFLLLLSAH